MVFKAKCLVIGLAVCIISIIIGAQCCAMQPSRIDGEVCAGSQQKYTLSDVINANGTGAGQKILSYLPNLKDLAALHMTCRALCRAWDHERMLPIYGADIKADKLPELKRLLNSMRALNPISLNLSGNNLTVLPEEIKQLTQLRVLNLGGNHLAPAEIAKICTRRPQLQELTLFSNGLTALPEEIKQLTQLRVLRLGSNHLAPEEIAKICTRCPQLQELYLSYNNLTVLPEEIKQLTQLQVLDLSGNNLAPAEIAKICTWCPQLQELDLSSNVLTALPEEIKQLTQLQVLNLKWNNFGAEEREHIRQLLKQSAPNAHVVF
jgi:hypothetical protein